MVLITASVVVAWLLVRPSPFVRDFEFIPRRIALWCDLNKDLRTFYLSIGSLTLGAMLFIGYPQARFRVVAGLGLLLILGEILQIWVPHRTFSTVDLAYTAMAIGLYCLIEALWFAIRFGLIRIRRDVALRKE